MEAGGSMDTQDEARAPAKRFARDVGVSSAKEEAEGEGPGLKEL